MTCRLLVLVGALLVPAAQLSAQTTRLFLGSQPGDYIGGGIEQTYTEADGAFAARRNFSNGVSIAFNAPNFSHFWYVDFAAAGAVPLTVGIYEGAVRFPFQASNQPGLSVGGDGRGCNTLTGRFEVLEAVYGATGDVVSFAADFEQHCEGAPPALVGSVHFNADAPIAPRINLTLTGCTQCHPGDVFSVRGRLTNPGASIPVELKLGVRLPDGTPLNRLLPIGQHLVVTLPAELDSTFPVYSFTWPAGAPAGAWRVEGTLLEPALGKTHSRDVKVFGGHP
jgi:hypothetical protein